MIKLYDVLIDSDATMLEINPMTEDKNGQGICSLSRQYIAWILLYTAW